MGAYARSSKEGQYYLMPLFLVTMPLVFLTLAPGVELNPFYSLVPVTGVALLMQRLMTTTMDKVPWLYFGPVIVPIILYSWLALSLGHRAISPRRSSFPRSRAARIGLWIRHVFRDKEALPSTGQCFSALCSSWPCAGFSSPAPAATLCSSARPSLIWRSPRRRLYS